MGGRPRGLRDLLHRRGVRGALRRTRVRLADDDAGGGLGAAGLVPGWPAGHRHPGVLRGVRGQQPGHRRARPADALRRGHGPGPFVGVAGHGARPARQPGPSAVGHGNLRRRRVRVGHRPRPLHRRESGGLSHLRPHAGRRKTLDGDLHRAPPASGGRQRSAGAAAAGDASGRALPRGVPDPAGAGGVALGGDRRAVPVRGRRGDPPDRRDRRHQRAQGTRGQPAQDGPGPVGGRQPQGRVPGHAGARAAQPAGADPQWRGAAQTPGRGQSAGDGGGRRDGAADAAHGAAGGRPDRRQPDHPQQARAAPPARRVGPGAAYRDRSQPAAGRGQAPSRRSFAAADAGVPGGRRHPTGAGVHQSDQQLGEVHRARRPYPRRRRTPRRRGAGGGARRRQRHPAADAAAGIRDVHPARPHAGALAGRARHRIVDGQAAGGDARWQHHAAQRGRRLRHLRGGAPAGGALAGAASWGRTTTATPPTAWRPCSR